VGLESPHVAVVSAGSKKKGLRAPRRVIVGEGFLMRDGGRRRAADMAAIPGSMSRAGFANR
jgi:hypothetical protein